MANVLGSLQVNLVAETASFNEGMSKAAAQAKATGGEIQRGLAGAKDAFEPIGESSREARESVMLFGEEVGVHVPRAVARMVAEVGPLHGILAAAFPIIGGLALIEVLGKGIEKIEEFESKGERMAAAWERIDTQLASQTTEVIGKFDGLEEKIAEMEGGKLAGLNKRLQDFGDQLGVTIPKMDQTSAAVQKEILAEAGWLESLTRIGLEIALLETKLPVVGDLLRSNNAGAIGFAEEYLAGTAKHVSESMDEFTAKLENVAATKGAPAAIGLVAQEMVHVREEMEKAPDNTALQHYFTWLSTQMHTLMIEAKTQYDQFRELELEKANQQRQIESEAAKHSLDITTSSLNAQVAAARDYFERGIIDAEQWRDAQVQAANLAYAAHESYYRRAEALASNDPEKQAALKADQRKYELETLAKTTEDLAAAEATYNKEVEKTQSTWVTDDGVVKPLLEGQKDLIDRLTKGVLDMEKAMQALAASENQITQTLKSQDFTNREQSINDAAKIGIISEQQKRDALRALYAEEENDALDHLRSLSHEQAEAIEATQAALDADPNNVALKTTLANQEAAFNDTYNKILETQQQFDQKMHEQSVAAAEDAVKPWKTAFDGLEDELAKALTGKKFDFSKIGDQLSESLTKDFLKRAFQPLESRVLGAISGKSGGEGESLGIPSFLSKIPLLGGLLGGSSTQPDGSSNNPLYVELANPLDLLGELSSNQPGGLGDLLDIIGGGGKGGSGGGGIFDSIFGSLFGSGSSDAADASSNIGDALDFFGGALAGGGDVRPGQAYLVGEKHPELFMPDTAGTIVPNLPSGKGSRPSQSINVVNNFNGIKDHDSFKASSSQIAASQQNSAAIAYQRSRR